jgi:hypothetical protein
VVSMVAREPQVLAETGLRIRIHPGVKARLPHGEGLEHERQHQHPGARDHPGDQGAVHAGGQGMASPKNPWFCGNFWLAWALPTSFPRCDGSGGTAARLLCAFTLSHVARSINTPDEVSTAARRTCQPGGGRDGPAILIAVITLARLSGIAPSQLLPSGHGRRFARDDRCPRHGADQAPGSTERNYIRWPGSRWPNTGSFVQPHSSRVSPSVIVGSVPAPGVSAPLRDLVKARRCRAASRATTMIAARTPSTAN